MFFITNSRQNKQKKRKTGFSELSGNIVHHRLHEAEEEEALERLSLFLSLSLCWEKIHSPRRQLLTHFVQCTSQRSAKRTLRITLYNHRPHHHLPAKGREREISEISLSRAHRARAAQARLGEIQNKKTSLFSCCSYSYLKLTHSIIR